MVLKLLKFFILLGFTNLALMSFVHSEDTLKNKVTINYEKDIFNDGTAAWDLYSLSAGHQFSWGPLIIRGNAAQRFNTKGSQFEIDAYPHLRDGTYLYLNYGYSGSSIFPKNRFGTEIYQALPHAYEMSLGMRDLWFQSTKITLYTGSIAKYLGNYYFFFRPYITPSSVGPSRSGTLGLRRYLDDEQYIAISIGTGLSISQDASLAVIKLNAEKASLDCYLKMPHDFFIHPTLSYSREEIRQAVFRKQWGLDLSLEKRF
jgi:YaiO family outer membrane protein